MLGQACSQALCVTGVGCRRASYRLSISMVVCVELDSVRLARSQAVCSLRAPESSG